MHSMIKIFALAVPLALMMALAPLAKAGPASTEAVMDFETQALDADGCFRLVHCSHAHQVDIGDTVVRENYRCKFVDDAGFWGTPELPTRAMVWDYASSMDIEPNDECPITTLEGPFRWFSDVEFLLPSFDGCFMYTHAAGGGNETDSNWRMVITPSGNVNVTVVYDPPVFELGDGSACPE
jgi:hypothetical protein